MDHRPIQAEVNHHSQLPHATETGISFNNIDEQLGIRADSTFFKLVCHNMEQRGMSECITYCISFFPLVIISCHSAVLLFVKFCHACISSCYGYFKINSPSRIVTDVH